MDMMVVPEIVVDAAVAFVRTFHVDLLDPLRNLLVFSFPAT